MKEDAKRLPPTNWKALHGLDTQGFNSAVVTMDTTSASISIRLHMELREGHATSDIQIKVLEINAAEWRSDFVMPRGLKIQFIIVLKPDLTLT